MPTGLARLTMNDASVILIDWAGRAYLRVAGASAPALPGDGQWRDLVAISTITVGHPAQITSNGADPSSYITPPVVKIEGRTYEGLLSAADVDAVNLISGYVNRRQIPHPPG